jgi:hypothetical protein
MSTCRRCKSGLEHVLFFGGFYLVGVAGLLCALNPPLVTSHPASRTATHRACSTRPNDYEKWKHIFDKENESTIQEKKRKKDDKKEESRRNMGAAIAPPASLVGEIVSSVPAANADRFGGSAGGGMFSGGGSAAAAAPPSSASAAATEAEFADPFANLPVTGYGASSEPAASHTASQAKAVVHPPAKAPAMTGEDAWNARARKSGQAPGPPPPPPSAPPPSAAHHQTGQSGPVLYRQVPAAMVQASVSTPSHMVLLKNLVGPGEVDADLERETAEECSKFGTVVKTEVKEVCTHLLVCWSRPTCACSVSAPARRSFVRGDHAGSSTGVTVPSLCPLPSVCAHHLLVAV